MDQLLVHQLLSILGRLHKSSSNENADPEALQLKANSLLERLLSGKMMKDARISLGVLLANSIRAECYDIAHQLLDYLEIKEGGEMTISLRTAVVNYALPGGLTSLHLAASRPEPNLVSLLLAYEAHPWQPTIKGELAFHYALREHQSSNHSAAAKSILLAHLQHLTDVMLASTDNELGVDDVGELCRRHAIVPRLISTATGCDVETTLELLRRFNQHSDGATNCSYLDFALQVGKCPEPVINYLLEQIKLTWTAAVSTIPISPLDLALNHGNLQAACRALDLGFELSAAYFRAGCNTFRHVLVPEENYEDFPFAKRVFDYLLDQVVLMTCSTTNNSFDLADPNEASRLRVGLKMLQNLVSTNVRYFAQAESMINNQARTYAIQQTGNLLTYALMTHCGHAAQRLLELPFRWPALEMKMLQYYQFSRFDVHVIQDLLREDRVKMIDFINFHPRYMPLSRANVGRISDELRDLVLANERGVRSDQGDYLRFLDWYDQFRAETINNKRQKSLQETCRAYLIIRWFAFDPCTGSLEQFAAFLKRRQLLESYLPRPLFEYIFKSINLIKY